MRVVLIFGKKHHSPSYNTWLINFDVLFSVFGLFHICFTFNYFQTAAVVGDQQSVEDRAEGIFNKMDVNSDGKVTR